MRQNLTVDRDHVGRYATDLFTEKAVETINNHNKSIPMFMMMTHLAPHSGNEYDPLQAPAEEIAKFKYIRNKNRRTYAAMVSKLDESVGKVVQALGNNDMLDNTIILFMSDNGAPVEGELEQQFKFWLIYKMKPKPITEFSNDSGQLANDGSNYPFKGVRTWEMQPKKSIDSIQ